MLINILCFGAGLIIGWNLLPQPAIVKGWYDQIFKRTTS